MVGNAYSAFLAVILKLILSNSVEYIRLAHNGIWQTPLKYIRYRLFQPANSLSIVIISDSISNRTAPWQEADTPTLNGWRTWSFPTYPSDSNTSVRCGRNSLAWASQTETLKVKAGDEIEFLSTNAPPLVWGNKTLIQWDECPENKGGCTPAESVRKFFIL